MPSKKKIVKKSGKKSGKKTAKAILKRSVMRRNRIHRITTSLKRKACSGMRVQKKYRKISGWQKKVGAIMRSRSLKQAFPDDINSRLSAAVDIAKGNASMRGLISASSAGPLPKGSSSKKRSRRSRLSLSKYSRISSRRRASRSQAEPVAARTRSKTRK